MKKATITITVLAIITIMLKKYFEKYQDQITFSSVNINILNYLKNLIIQISGDFYSPYAIPIPILVTKADLISLDSAQRYGSLVQPYKTTIRKGLNYIALDFDLEKNAFNFISQNMAVDIKVYIFGFIPYSTIEPLKFNK